MLTSLKKSVPLLLVMTFVAGVYGKMEIHYNPPTICALKGSSVKMSCSSLDNNEKAIWFKGKSQNLCSDPKKRGVWCYKEDKDTFSITLTDVTEADRGIYYCIQRKEPAKQNHGVQLDVTDLQVETKQSVKEGDSVTLRCKSNCSLPEETTFIWYENTETVNKGITTLNQLYLWTISRFDAGLYQCAIKGNEHLISPGVYLNVEYPQPTVSVSISSSGKIVEGDSVTLRCSGDLNPPQDFQWFKEVIYVGHGEIYRFPSISTNDSGEYKCRARNRQGMKYSDPVVLDVMYAPRDVVVTVNSSDAIVSLSCSSDSNPPALNFSWFKEDQSSAVGSGQSFTALQSGQYYCEAHNPHGSQRSASVLVIVKESSLSLITVGISAAVVLISVILISVSFWLYIRCNKEVKSEDPYMTLNTKSRCSEYDTLDNMKRLYENTPSPEDQEPVYYNTG